jgi:hypothetical protein
MASNDFLPFASAGGANVVTQSVYAAMAALGPGFVTGIAESNQLNKVWRQSSIAAAILAQFIADVTGANSVDDGTTATLLGNLITAIQAADYQVDTSVAANAITLTYSPVPITPLTDGAQYSFKVAHNNTGATTLSINGSGAHAILDQTGTALAGGELVAGYPATVIYSTSLSSFVLTSNAGGFQHSSTPVFGDNSTKIATTAFVESALPTGNAARVIANVSSSGAINHQAGSSSIASVTHTGTGTYTVTFGSALPAATYAAMLTVSQAGFIACNVTSQSAGSFTYQTFVAAGATLIDAAVNITVFY